jgi:hypothetical protein
MILAWIIGGIGQALITAIGRTAACDAHTGNPASRRGIVIDPFARRVTHRRLTMCFIVAYADVVSSARHAWEWPSVERRMGEPLTFYVLVFDAIAPSQTREARYCDGRCQNEVSRHGRPFRKLYEPTFARLPVRRLRPLLPH